MGLKTIRESRGMSRFEVSQRTGMTTRTITKHETGESSPNLSSLRKYTAALECEISDIVETQECRHCDQELPMNCFPGKKDQKRTTCIACCKDNGITREKPTEDPKERPLTKLERTTYFMGVRIGKRKGWEAKRITKQLAKEHQRNEEFIWEVIKHEVLERNAGNKHGNNIECGRTEAQRSIHNSSERRRGAQGEQASLV